MKFERLKILGNNNSTCRKTFSQARSHIFLCIYCRNQIVCMYIVMIIQFNI